MDRNILISDDRHGLPYSKGLMASTIMATGLSPKQAFDIAKKIQDILISLKKFSITLDELHYVAHFLLNKEIGKEYARRYGEWLAVNQLKRPIIIILGGTTGVGKSTIAVEAAHRLGITRVVSTDSIREVMRAVFSKELMPALYESSFLAYKTLRFPFPSVMDPLVVGFREQTSVVAVGVNATIERAVKEASHLVMEGVHIAPGFVSIDIPLNKAIIVPIVITAEDPEQHKSHFYIRDIETGGMRNVERYRHYFENIRRIGEYVEELADEYGFAKISGLHVDTAVLRILDVCMSKVSKSPGIKEVADDIERKSQEWKSSWEKKGLSEITI